MTAADVRDEIVALLESLHGVARVAPAHIGGGEIIPLRVTLSNGATIRIDVWQETTPTKDKP